MGPFLSLYNPKCDKIVFKSFQIKPKALETDLEAP